MGMGSDTGSAGAKDELAQSQERTHFEMHEMEEPMTGSG